MSVHKFSWKKPYNPEGKPRACVIRYGAYGDMAQAASVVAALKKQGYWVTLMCSHPSSELIALDPNVDEMIVQMQNQVPIQMLGHYWIWMEAKWRGKFDKWVNLTESVENNLLAMLGNVKFTWTPKARHQLMNFNYLEFQHKLAGCAEPFEPSFKFHASEEEKKWLSQEKARMAKAGITNTILWNLAGSSRTHKLYPHQAGIWQHVFANFPGWGVVTVGDGSCADLENGFEGEPRLWRTSGKWTMRQVATFMESADVVCGPETGVMSMAAFYPMPKILFLSHSTVENLSRDWVNTTSIWAPELHCPGRGPNEVAACHKMLPSFEGCRRDPTYGCAQCCVDTKPEWVWYHLQKAMIEGAGGLWEPSALLT
jgi:ADP-heptose:LPS heptosyltransferase